jgi:flavorubredoxin
LAKVFVVYDSKYGNTKLAAENVLAGIKEIGEFETAIGYVKKVNIKDVAGYDAIVLGAPNHMGRPSRAIKKFVDELSRQDLKTRQVAVFGTYSGRIRVDDRAVKKMEKTVGEKLPNLTLIKPSLSVKVNGVSGPVVESELPKCVNFGKKIAEQIRTQ